MSRATQDSATVHLASRTWLSQSMAALSSTFLGSSPFARHYWGNHCLFSLPAGTKMFQFPAFAFRLSGIMFLQNIGLSHSEIRGSKVICTFPRLFAAYHVLHRL